jgi:hypothetical protein
VDVAIHIVGAGTNSTTITGSGDTTLIRFESDDFTDPTDPMTVAHLYLKYSGFSGNDRHAIDLALPASRNDLITNLRIMHCKFEFGGRMINGCGYVLIDHCTFINFDSCFHNQQYLSTETAITLYGTHEWDEGLRVGTTNSWVIENCVFPRDNGITSDANEIMYGQYASRYTFRFNLADADSMTSHPALFLDAHGSGPPEEWRGSHLYEIYSNTNTCDNTYAFCGIRGGTMIISSNVFLEIDDSGPGVFILKDEGQSTYGNPSTRDHITNSFFWANSFNGDSDQENLVSIEAGSEPYVVEGTHFYLRSVQSGDSLYPYTPLVYPHPRATDEGGVTEFYVATDGHDSNIGTKNSPWLTVSKANQTLEAGDTVYIRGGVYEETAWPTNNGSAGSPITYESYVGETAILSNVATVIKLVGQEYVTFSGLKIEGATTRWLEFQSATNNVVTNCTFVGEGDSGTAWAAIYIYDNSQSNLVTDCWGADWGYESGGEDNGSVINIGDDTNDDFSYYNRIENSTFAHGGHDVISYNSGHTIIRGNYFFNDDWVQSGTYGNRIGGTMPEPEVSGWNLVESNYIAFAGDPPDATSAAGINHRSVMSIFRKNSFYDNTDVGLKFDGGNSAPQNIQSNFVYNNTFFNNGLTDNDAHIGLEDWDAGPLIINSNSFINNLFYGSTDTWYEYSASTNDQVLAGNFYQLSDPLFTDVASYTTNDLPDFTLQSTSPCRNNGTWLTTITTATGSGVTFTVNQAWFFQDGWGGIAPDEIQLEGQSSSVTISSINYSTHAITVDESVSWTQGDGVALPFNGSVPDQGAFEYTRSDVYGTATVGTLKIGTP